MEQVKDEPKYNPPRQLNGRDAAILALRLVEVYEAAGYVRDIERLKLAIELIATFQEGEND